MTSVSDSSITTKAYRKMKYRSQAKPWFERLQSVNGINFLHNKFIFLEKWQLVLYQQTLK